MVVSLLLETGTGEIGVFSSHWIDYFKLIFVMAGVLGLCYVLPRYLLPRLLGLSQLKAVNRGAMEMVARFVLEPRRTLYVIKLGSQCLLLSSSENGIQLLTELDPHDVKAMTNEKCNMESDIISGIPEYAGDSQSADDISGSGFPESKSHSIRGNPNRTRIK